MSMQDSNSAPEKIDSTVRKVGADSVLNTQANQAKEVSQESSLLAVKDLSVQFTTEDGLVTAVNGKERPNQRFRKI